MLEIQGLLTLCGFINYITYLLYLLIDLVLLLVCDTYTCMFALMIRALLVDLYVYLLFIQCVLIETKPVN